MLDTVLESEDTVMNKVDSFYTTGGNNLQGEHTNE